VVSWEVPCAVLPQKDLGILLLPSLVPENRKSSFSFSPFSRKPAFETPPLGTMQLQVWMLIVGSGPKYLQYRIHAQFCGPNALGCSQSTKGFPNGVDRIL